MPYQLKNARKKAKEELITDLLVCISHDFDRENDLLCMTEQYYNHPEKRKELEEEMLELLLGNPYCNPYLMYHCYGQQEIVLLEEILEGLEAEMSTTHNPKLTLCNAVVQIGELHEKCNGELIDDWRAPRLETFLLAVADFAEASLILESQKRW